MSKWRKRIILLACAILALALVWAMVPEPEPEPSYQGRRLSRWVYQWQQSNYNDAEAVGAIRAIGTNAIPTSLAWITYEASPLRNKLADLVVRLSPRLRRGILSPEQRAYAAMDVFAVLGPDAHAAIPELTRVAQTSSDPDRADRCMQALSRLGPEALPSVVTLVTNSPLRTRATAIATLHQPAFRKQPEAVSILIQCLDDKNYLIAGLATNVLLDIAPEVLTNASPK